jgi:DNA mismatch repair ATPase MutL
MGHRYSTARGALSHAIPQARKNRVKHVAHAAGFAGISGHDAKLEKPRERSVITTFCYGFNLGPTQTARSIKGLDRRQVSFVNQRHVTEEKLNQSITEVINAYARFPFVAYP